MLIIYACFAAVGILAMLKGFRAIHALKIKSFAQLYCSPKERNNRSTS
jgi:hypothetical protein